MAQDRIDQNRADFFIALGSAISQWQNVEHELFRIFQKLIRPADSMATGAAFHAVINFNSRLAMTNAAAKQAIKNAEKLKLWTNLNNRITRQAKRRNTLAHFNTLVHRDTHEWFLMPNFLDPGQDASRIDKKIDVASIDAYRTAFFKLGHDMQQFADSLPWQPGASRRKGQ